MSRTDIPMDKPLSDENRAYLVMRGEDSRVKWFDDRFPPKGDAEDEEDAETEDDYDEWTVPQLQARVKTLNDAGAQISPAGNKKENLITALREYDALPDEDDEE